MPNARLWGFLACCAFALAGVSLGAELQHETLPVRFYAPDPSRAAVDSAQVAVGNVIFLTGGLVAGGITAALWLLGRPTRSTATRTGWSRPMRRILVLAAAAGSLFVLTNLAQMDWPFYFTCNQAGSAGQPTCQQAVLRVQLLTHNEPSVPSLLVPVWAAFIGTALGASWAGRRLLAVGPPATDVATVQRLLRRQIFAAALAFPTLAIAFWGSLRLVFSLTPPPTGPNPYLVLLPLAALACGALALVEVEKVRQLGRLAAHPLRQLAVEDAWGILLRVQLGALAVLLAVAAAAFAAHDAPNELLGAPKTFSTTLRGYTAGLALLTVPLIPSLATARAGTRALRAPAAPSAPDAQAALPAWATLGAAGLALAGSGIATFAAHGPLWAWLAALLPMGIAAARWGTRDGSLVLLLAGVAAWAAGNSTFAAFTGRTDNLLAFENNPGVAAMWRVAGAVLAASGLAIWAQRAGALPRPRGTGAAIAFAACAAGIGFLELPVGAWVDSTADGDALAIGSLLAAQDPAVRVVAHAVGLLLALGAGYFLARLVRPEWFARGGRPMPTPGPAGWQASPTNRAPAPQTAQP